MQRALPVSACSSGSHDDHVFAAQWLCLHRCDHFLSLSTSGFTWCKVHKCVLYLIMWHYSITCCWPGLQYLPLDVGACWVSCNPACPGLSDKATTSVRLCGSATMGQSSLQLPCPHRDNHSSMGGYGGCLTGLSGFAIPRRYSCVRTMLQARS